MLLDALIDEAIGLHDLSERCVNQAGAVECQSHRLLVSPLVDIALVVEDREWDSADLVEIRAVASLRPDDVERLSWMLTSDHRRPHIGLLLGGEERESGGHEPSLGALDGAGGWLVGRDIRQDR